jgi:hypothetical protein
MADVICLVDETALLLLPKCGLTDFSHSVVSCGSIFGDNSSSYCVIGSSERLLQGDVCRVLILKLRRVGGRPGNSVRGEDTAVVRSQWEKAEVGTLRKVW